MPSLDSCYLSLGLDLSSDDRRFHRPSRPRGSRLATLPGAWRASGTAKRWGGGRAVGIPGVADEPRAAYRAADDTGDGSVQFDAAVRFTQRYPARIVVLCPRAEGGADLAMRAKIYSECFIGRSQREMSCIEAVILTYPQENRQFLEDQVSIIIEADLPIYYWVHRMSQVHKIGSYQWLLRNSSRCLIDSAISTPDARTYPWPRPDGFRDLVHARLLPVRQSVGQFLSAYEPRTIVRGLREVRVAGGVGFDAEARVLLDWVWTRLKRAGLRRRAERNVRPGESRRERRLRSNWPSPTTTAGIFSGGRIFRRATRILKARLRADDRSCR